MYLRKAINSGDTDLIYHVILELQQREKPSNFHLIIREYPVASKLYTLYCRYHSPDSLADWLQQVWIHHDNCAEYLSMIHQEDDFGGLGRISYTDSYSTGRLETRLAQLVTCQET